MVPKSPQYVVAMTLHWIAAVFIAYNLLDGWRLSTFEPDMRRLLRSVHASIGVVILGFMLIRWWWRRKYNLYAQPQWWRQPRLLLQWLFYPLLLLQPILGLLVAIFNDYDVRVFGFINVSALADNEALGALLQQSHSWLAGLLIVLVVLHGVERLRQLYV